MLAAKNAVVVAMAVILASLANAAPTSTPRAQPFGISIGMTTCQQASKTLGGKIENESDSGGVVQVEAADANALYPGAESVKVECFAADQPVVRLTLTASKGGMGNSGGQEAYRNLANKYKLTAGSPIPSLGNGYARFSAGDSVIEIKSPHLAFEFTVFYLTSDLYKKLTTNSEAKDQQDAAKKRGSL